MTLIYISLIGSASTFLLEVCLYNSKVITKVTVADKERDWKAKNDIQPLPTDFRDIIKDSPFNVICI